MNIIINDKNYIHYEIKENIIITDINFENNDYLKSLIDKLCCACYLDNDKLIVYQGNLDLSSYHFQKEKDGFILDLKTTRIISIHMAPQIRLIQNNDSELVEKIQSSIINTIPIQMAQ